MSPRHIGRHLTALNRSGRARVWTLFWHWRNRCRIHNAYRSEIKPFYES